MNQLMFSDNGQQPQLIIVNVVVNAQQTTLNLQTNIDPEIPFNVFINGIKEQIFAQKMQGQYEDTIEYQLENKPDNIQSDEKRTLKFLGFFNNCRIIVRLKLKGGR